MEARLLEAAQFQVPGCPLGVQNAPGKLRYVGPLSPRDGSHQCPFVHPEWKDLKRLGNPHPLMVGNLPTLQLPGSPTTRRFDCSQPEEERTRKVRAPRHSEGTPFASSETCSVPEVATTGGASGSTAGQFLLRLPLPLFRWLKGNRKESPAILLGCLVNKPTKKIKNNRNLLGKHAVADERLPLCTNLASKHKLRLILTLAGRVPREPVDYATRPNHTPQHQEHNSRCFNTGKLH